MASIPSGSPLAPGADPAASKPPAAPAKISASQQKIIDQLEDLNPGNPTKITFTTQPGNKEHSWQISSGSKQLTWDQIKKNPDALNLLTVVMKTAQTADDTFADIGHITYKKTAKDDEAQIGVQMKDEQKSGQKIQHYILNTKLLDLDKTDSEDPLVQVAKSINNFCKKAAHLPTTTSTAKPAQAATHSAPALTASTQQTTSTTPSSFGNNTGAMKVNGIQIPANIQNQQKTTYNWQQAYANPTKGLGSGGKFSYCQQENQKYAQNAINNNAGAIIAHTGTFSNFGFPNDRLPFHDPISNLKFPSAEHAFHYYKFPPGSSERQQILNAPDPKAALDIANKATNAPKHPNWNETIAKSNLMVYVQLCKAAESSTGLRAALEDSGDAFIIEDTSKTGENKWGDNGDGTGENKLGWAQMQAREIIKGWAGKSDTQIQQELIDYFNQNVNLA